MRDRRPDLVLVVLIAAGGAWAGGTYRHAFASRTGYWAVFTELGAGVAFACGHGFTDPGAATTPYTPAMTEFLAASRDSITCADLPPDFPPDNPNFTQSLYRYLMTAMALVWIVSGKISWSGLTPMFAVAYAATLVAAYGIFRLMMGRVMSAVATFVLFASPVHLGNLAYFRDYAKAPFILVLILIMARFARGPLTPRRSLAFSAVFGTALGIGFGFRNDLLMYILPWVAVVLLCLPGRPLSNLKLKALCLAVSALVFVATAWPILRAYARGSNSGHVTLLGMMASFDEKLGVDRSIYNWGYEYNDHQASRLVMSFSTREYGRQVVALSAEYDRAAADYILRIVRHFPADVLARVYGSILGILDDLPFTGGALLGSPPTGVTHPKLVAFYVEQTRVLRWLHGIGTPAVVLALLIISARSVAVAITLLVFLLYFTGYPSMQYTNRHFFHFEFITWGAIAFVLERMAVAVFRLVRRPAGIHGSDAAWRPMLIAGRVASFVALATMLVAGPLLALRWYQAPHVRALLASAYLGAEREPLAATKTPVSAGLVLLDLSSMWIGPESPNFVHTEYVVVELSPRRCDALQVSMTFRYKAITPEEGAHHAVARLAPGDRSTFVFFPAFRDSYIFKGVELAPAVAECVASFSRVKADQVPDVLLYAVFTPQWERVTLYDTFSRFEPLHGRQLKPVQFSTPPTLTVPVQTRPAPFVAEPPGSEFLAPTVTRRADAALVVKGRAALDPWLLILNQPLMAGSIVIGKGELRSGILTLNLSSKAGMTLGVNVTAPGEFVAAIAVPQSDTYAVAARMRAEERWIDSHLPRSLTNWLRSMPWFHPEHEAIITTLGWLPARVMADTETNH